MDFENFNTNQLLTACGILESTIVSFIRDLDSKGIDTSSLRIGLNDAHAAVEGLME